MRLLMEFESVIDVTELFEFVFFKADEPLKGMRSARGTVQAMNAVGLIRGTDEKHAKDFFITVSAKLSGFMPRMPVEPGFNLQALDIFVG